SADNPAEVVAISDRAPIESGRSYGLSAWVKLEGVQVNPKREVETAVLFTVTYHTDAEGWAEVAGEDFFVIDQSAADHDWRLYQFTFTPPAEATRLSVRARLQHQTFGDTYWDDFRLYPVGVAKQNYTFDESRNPAYWGPRNDGQAIVEWAGDQYRSPERSLKISDDGGDDDPYWISGNLAKLNWNSPNGLGKDIEMVIGGWVKTENVNTNPADANAEIRLTFSFFDADQNLIFGEPVVLNIPQDQASVDWTEIKNQVPIVLPVEADSLVVMFHFGPNAVGTAWLDDIFMHPAEGAEGWIGDLFNSNFGVPDGWFYWKDWMSFGKEGYGVVSITSTAAHSGLNSLRIADTDDNPAEVVAISNRTPVQPNTEYLVGAWVKLDGVNPLPVFDVEKAIFFTVTYHSDAEGWAETHGADFFVVNQTAADRDWALYTFRIRTEENDRRISIRARLQHEATGDVYWDDFFVVPIAQVMAGNGFENAEMPAYWTKANEGDATVAWDDQQFRSPQRSLMIQESAGDDAPMWVTHANMAKLQWNPVDGIPANVEIEVGGWVKTENLNTNPASADEQVHLVWEFYNAEGALIFGEPIVLPVPQDQATIDWSAIQNDVPIVLPVNADSLAIKFQFGADAVGTVWLDDIFMRLAEGAEGWIGDLYNANFGVPEGWFFWKDHMSEGEKDYGVVSITRDAAFTGDHSLLLSDTADNPAEVVAISNRNPIQGNKVYTVQAWVKTEGVNLNLENDVEKAIFFTATYHTDAEGWAEFSGQDFFVVDQTVTDKDWSLYVFTLTTPPDAKRMSIRARMQHQAVGNVYWDDFAVVEGNVTRVGGTDLPVAPLVYSLAQNHPNPFNPSTTIRFNLPQTEQVSLVVYDLLGKIVRTLVDGVREAGEHSVLWDGRDETGLAASSGIYFYVLNTPRTRLVRKMMFVK
ncbi:carbohydrate binding domain-containing protein, partial [candidate division KSB1 bacterium]|nr:carbohydrate binding domain-containing protein [candidate division KSB1 bacterium]